MKRILLLLVAMTLAVAGARAADLPVLGKAPAWKLKDTAGHEVSSAEFKGKVVVLDFWATWCPPCRAEIPGYIALQKKYADKGLVVIGVSVDEEGAAAVTPFAKQHGVTYKMLLASDDVVSAFGGIEAIPTTFLIDRDGNIRAKHVGYVSEDDFDQQLQPLLK